ncbi:MAG: DNA polymerase III subunit alpha [Proteobacteria bacterium]|nr:DNA polymerase III subunit alpha [Pseudomonadota bacterium]MCP4919132.1 DNA polymerase III subunit alpha [Pseudomonadota bacterium]
MGFAHLHVHSQFSLLDGAIPIKKLAPRAAELGQSSVALTDHCNLYGAVQFHKSCKGAGVHPVFGSGLWVQPDGQSVKDPAGQLGGYHLVCLIENQVGYKNLCALITEAIFDGMFYKPRVDLTLLEKYREGLIVLTSGLRGPVRADLARGRTDEARWRVEQLGEIFGPDNLFLELQDVGFDADERANEGCRELAGALGLKTVVTNAVHYLNPMDAPTLDLLQCIGSGCSLNDDKRRRPVTDQLFLKSEEAMRALFPDDGPALDRTVEIAERCQYAFDYDTYYFPASTPPSEDADAQPNWAYFYDAFPPPRDFGMGEGTPDIPEPGTGSLGGYFKWYSRRGLELRLERVGAELHPQYWERLDIEFGIIESMGFPAYFLIVAEFINWAKDQEIPVGPGRGSAAGSLVAYAMRITDIDPIRFDLLFERFLNPERISMPDVDVDFCQDRREEVIEHTRQKYGTEYVAQIITYGKLQAKLAIRDVSRVADMSFGDADRLAKLIPNELGIKLGKALEEEGLQKLYDGDPRVRRIYSLAQRVEGLTRQTGIHAAGVVVADRPLVELSPLYRDGPEGGPVVQYDMKSAESIGLIKFDFLGLKTLDQIRDAVELIERNTGDSIDMSAIDVEDKAAYNLLQRGDGLGVFQVESSGMRELLTKLKPSVLDDVVALVALYRPGPLNSGMVDDFVERKHGRTRVEFPVPELEPILNNTYGVIVYQEQVMQIAQLMASYSLGEADLLRRAMGKKDLDEMGRQKSRFLEGAVKNGFDKNKSSDIFDLLALFAEYGFNKSHSAAYGYITYQTAWLKANYRAEYMAAVLTIDSANTDKVLLYVGDCKRAGLDILRPDVNESVWAFDVPKDERGSIRYGLGAIKGVGQSAIEALVEARVEAGGSFSGFMDCLEKLDYSRINKKALESLIKAGAFDWTGHHRAQLHTAMESAMSYAQREQADKASGQVGLFSMLGASAPKPSFRMPDVAEWSLAKELGMERDALGFFLSGHPVSAFARLVDRRASCRVAELERLGEGATISVAVMKATARVVRTRRGDKMAFLQMDDDTGAVEVVFFSKAWEACAKKLDEGEPVLVTGELEKSTEGVKIRAESVELLAELERRSTTRVVMQLRPSELTRRNLQKLDALLKRHEGPVRSFLHVVREDGVAWKASLPEDRNVAASSDLKDEVADVLLRRDVVRFE